MKTMNKKKIYRTKGGLDTIDVRVTLYSSEVNLLTLQRKVDKQKRRRKEIRNENFRKIKMREGDKELQKGKRK